MIPAGVSTYRDGRRVVTRQDEYPGAIAGDLFILHESRVALEELRFTNPYKFAGALGTVHWERPFPSAVMEAVVIRRAIRDAWDKRPTGGLPPCGRCHRTFDCSCD